MLSSMLNDLFAVLFPERCVGCAKEGSALCALCERTITMNPTAVSRSTAALFDYTHPLVKKAVWALKYDRRSALADYFGNALYREFFAHLARGTAPKTHEEMLLLPVPSSPGTIHERGTNHAEAIARAIALCGKKDGIPLVADASILEKTKDTPRQVETEGRTERMHNVRGTFSVKQGDRVNGKTIVLIDDVITTGATLREARRALREHKPKRILAIAVAH